MVKQKVDMRVFRHAECKSGLVLTLLRQRVLTTFSSKHMTVFAGFLQTDWFLGKTRQSTFLEYTPLLRLDQSLYTCPK